MSDYQDVINLMLGFGVITSLIFGLTLKLDLLRAEQRQVMLNKRMDILKYAEYLHLCVTEWNTNDIAELSKRVGEERKDFAEKVNDEYSNEN